jgi:hypothetical protein
MNKISPWHFFVLAHSAAICKTIFFRMFFWFINYYVAILWRKSISGRLKSYLESLEKVTMGRKLKFLAKI